VTQVEQVMFPAASIASGAEAETATVPEASGKVQVRAAVRSAEVIVPVKDAVAVVVCGLMAIVSVFAVVELKVALFVVDKVTACVPEACVKPVSPEMAPAEDMAQLVVETATVFEPPPIATAPVVVPVPILTGKLDEAFRFTAAPVTVAPRLPVRSWATVKAPLLVVVIPDFPSETEVAFVVPRFKAAAESTVKAPAEVDQVEAAPPVRVSAPPEVKDEAAVGVRRTAPAPLAVKFPEVRTKATFAPVVVIVGPAV